MIILVSKAFAAPIDWTLIKVSDSKVSNIPDLITIAANWVSLIAGAMAFFYLVYSGILYITSAGNAENAKKGQQGIINAIIGIIVIIGAWVIIQAVVGSATFNK